MTKKMLLSMVVVACSSNAFAFVNIGEYVSQSFNKNKSAQRIKSANKCVNFTGVWKGICDDNGVKKPSTIEYQQRDCSALTTISTNAQGERSVNYADLSPSNLTHSGQSNSFYGMNIAFATAWSSDQQVLQLVGGAVLSSAFLGAPVNFQVSGQMMMEKEELLQFMHITGASDGDHDQTCRYSRVK